MKRAFVDLHMVTLASEVTFARAALIAHWHLPTLTDSDHIRHYCADLRVNPLLALKWSARGASLGGGRHVHPSLLPRIRTSYRISRDRYCEKTLDWLAAHGTFVAGRLHFDGAVLERKGDSVMSEKGRGCWE
jgi:hypothetical protein